MYLKFDMMKLLWTKQGRSKKKLQIDTASSLQIEKKSVTVTSKYSLELSPLTTTMTN